MHATFVLFGSILLHKLKQLSCYRCRGTWKCPAMALPKVHELLELCPFGIKLRSRGIPHSCLSLSVFVSILLSFQSISLNWNVSKESLQQLHELTVFFTKRAFVRS
jgi:hypothetical protein